MLCITFHGLTGWLVSAVGVANCYGVDAYEPLAEGAGRRKKRKNGRETGGEEDGKKKGHSFIALLRACVRAVQAHCC